MVSASFSQLLPPEATVLPNGAAALPEADGHAEGNGNAATLDPLSDDAKAVSQTVDQVGGGIDMTSSRDIWTVVSSWQCHTYIRQHRCASCCLNSWNMQD